MKNCKTCGASLDDSAAFCVMCGAKLNDGVQTDLQTPPSANQIDYQAVEQAQMPRFSPREMFYKVTSSKKAMVATILIVVSFAISFISVIANIFYFAGDEFWAQMLPLMTDAGLDTAFVNSYVSIMSTVVNSVLLIMLVPSALSTIGILLIYLNSKNRGLKTRGFTWLKISCIIIVALYALIALLLFMVFVSTSGIFAILPLLLVMGLPVFIQICFITTIEKMSNVIKNDVNVSISTFVPVILIVANAFTALTGLTSGNLLTIAVGAISVVGGVMFAMCMFDFNNALALMRVKKMYDAPQNRGNGL